MNAQDPGGGGTKEKWAGRPNRRPAVKNNVHQATLLGRNSLDLPNSTQKLTYSTDEDAVMEFFFFTVLQDRTFRAECAYLNIK